MKTTKKILVLLPVLLISFNLMATNLTPNKQKQLKRKISAHMDYPENLINENHPAQVAVEVVIDENGNLKVEDANGNPKLIDYVKTKIERIKFESNTVKTCRFLYKIVFNK